MSDNNKTSDKKKICIVVTETEYELIAANARSVDRSMAAYVKELALNRIIVHNNYEAILEYTKVMNKMSSDINRALNYMVDIKLVYPADLKYIASLLKEVTELQRKLLQETHRERDYMRKYVRNLVEEVD